MVPVLQEKRKDTMHEVPQDEDMPKENVTNDRLIGIIWKLDENYMKEYRNIHGNNINDISKEYDYADKKLLENHGVVYNDELYDSNFDECNDSYEWIVVDKDKLFRTMMEYTK